MKLVWSIVGWVFNWCLIGGLVGSFGAAFVASQGGDALGFFLILLATCGVLGVLMGIIDRNNVN